MIFDIKRVMPGIPALLLIYFICDSYFQLSIFRSLKNSVSSTSLIFPGAKSPSSIPRWIPRISRLQRCPGKYHFSNLMISSFRQCDQQPCVWTVRVYFIFHKIDGRVGYNFRPHKDWWPSIHHRLIWMLTRFSCRRVSSRTSPSLPSPDKCFVRHFVLKSKSVTLFIGCEQQQTFRIVQPADGVGASGNQNESLSSLAFSFANKLRNHIGRFMQYEIAFGGITHSRVDGLSVQGYIRP